MLLRCGVRFALGALALLLLASPNFAAGDLTRQKPIEVTVELGTTNGSMTYTPNTLTFETGRLYKLVLRNPSPQKHYFTSYKLASKVFTRKVQVFYDDTRLAEIKGAIREIEVFPGGMAEWWFVPLQTGEFEDLHCRVKDKKTGVRHSEQGMVGKIVIR